MLVGCPETRLEAMLLKAAMLSTEGQLMT